MEVARAELRRAGLRYVPDHGPGITRKKKGEHFAFFSPDGRRITDEDEVTRLRKLAVPPAYEKVWICPDPRGHIQATGIDARGRKQYRYHAQWRELRDATKYQRMTAFGKALPSLRSRVDKDLSSGELSRTRVLAMLVRLLDRTLIRVGNDEYMKSNHSYGLTTMRTRHVDVHGATIRFHFRGKSGVQHEVKLADKRVARALKRCLEIPGQELFHYVDHEGARHAVDSGDVNAYLHDIAGDEFTAKDYRTWAASVMAHASLCNLPWKSTREMKKNVVGTITTVSQRLGNTPSVCKKSYIHPRVIQHYADGLLVPPKLSRPARGLAAEERHFLGFLSLLDA